MYESRKARGSDNGNSGDDWYCAELQLIKEVFDRHAESDLTVRVFFSPFAPFVFSFCGDRTSTRCAHAQGQRMLAHFLSSDSRGTCFSSFALKRNRPPATITDHS